MTAHRTPFPLRAESGRVASGRMLFPATRETHRLAVGWQGGEPIVFSVLHVNPDRATLPMMAKKA
ncbi:hypothetical protein [Dactylosporangium sp. NPDC049140]|uniref:hypothetical protein n=1 Tax=Dactylosporangium sp. NPDC049140 TaxID=3155647 RepID=UPI0033F071D7